MTLKNITLLVKLTIFLLLESIVVNRVNSQNIPLMTLEHLIATSKMHFDRLLPNHKIPKNVCEDFHMKLTTIIGKTYFQS